MTSILLITRHYPPAVSGGAKRPFLLAQALRRAGVEVRICAPSLPDGEPGWALPHPNRDPPTGNSPDRFSLRAIGRDLLLWPDPDIRWCRRAAQVVIASGWKPDWVLSTSPPESIHVAGEMLARRTGARWIADFRDLWLQNPHRRERRRFYRQIGERLLAGRLLARADLALAVDPVVGAEASKLGARRVVILPHFVAGTMPTPARLPGGVYLLHAGSVALSDPDADIRDLLGPFEVASSRNADLRLVFVGRLTDAEACAIAASPASSRIETLGVRPLEETLALMAGADGLVFVASGKMHVPPSKLVDYLAVGRPIIACGDGAWRADPRVPPGEAALAMSDVAAAPRSSAPKPPTADESASQLLALLSVASGRSRPA